MTIRYHTQDEHDQVVLASAATYENLKAKGYIVSVNPDGVQNHDIGGDNYPDVVVWKSDSSDFGHTIIIEEIETSESVNDKEALEWKKFSKVGAQFFLVVPKDLVAQAQELIKRHRISVDQVEAYWMDGDQVRFDTRA